MTVCDPLEEAAECATGCVSAPQVLINPFFSWQDFPFSLYGYVDITEIVALLQIAAKYAYLAYAFQQVGTRIDALHALQKRCDDRVGFCPRDRSQQSCGRKPRALRPTRIEWRGLARPWNAFFEKSSFYHFADCEIDLDDLNSKEFGNLQIIPVRTCDPTQ